MTFIHPRLDLKDQFPTLPNFPSLLVDFPLERKTPPAAVSARAIQTIAKMAVPVAATVKSIPKNISAHFYGTIPQKMVALFKNSCSFINANGIRVGVPNYLAKFLPTLEGCGFSKIVQHAKKCPLKIQPVLPEVKFFDQVCHQFGNRETCDKLKITLRPILADLSSFNKKAIEWSKWAYAEGEKVYDMGKSVYGFHKRVWNLPYTGGLGKLVVMANITIGLIGIGLIGALIFRRSPRIYIEQAKPQTIIINNDRQLPKPSNSALDRAVCDNAVLRDELYREAIPNCTYIPGIQSSIPEHKLQAICKKFGITSSGA